MIKFKTPKPKFLIIGSVVVLLIATAITLGVYKTRSSHAELQNAAPTFSAVLPAGHTIDDLGGWQKLTPPEGDPFFVFVDSINGVSINVSQQELPDAFAINPYKHVSELAQGYKANNKVMVGDTTVYIGSSANGPQSVIFTKNGLLVLIKSWSTLSDGDWVAYIQSLK